MNTAHTGSLLHPLMQQYIVLQRALGRRYHTEQYVLAGLDRFLADHPARDLTAETFAAWCYTQGHLKPGVRRARLRIVRNFCLYRQRTDPQCFVPDPHVFPAPHQPIHPHLFTAPEIARLLHAAACLKPVPRAPLRAAVFRLAIILLYTTGLRRGELLRLVIGDYDPCAQTLLIRVSKFHKSRYLVLAPDGAQEVEQYLQARRRCHLPIDAHIPLIGNGYAQGRAYTGGGLGANLRQLCHSAAIRTTDGRYPRVHDFRHSFAVQALLRWYRNGDDVQAKLPFLATYMGHVSIASTAYYLPFIEALAGMASARFAAQYAALVVPLSQPLEVNP
jgi:integrase/recombinase XerD